MVEVIITVLKVRNASMSFFSGSERTPNLFQRKQKHRRLIISDEERMRMIDQVKRCVICQVCLNDEKVIHHDHFTGEIYGVAHNSCNLKLRTQTFTPFFYNLIKYDAHHLLKYIEIQSEEKLTVIPATVRHTSHFRSLFLLVKAKMTSYYMKNFVSLTAIVFYPGVLTLWFQHSKQRTIVIYLSISKKLRHFAKERSFPILVSR